MRRAAQIVLLLLVIGAAGVVWRSLPREDNPAAAGAEPSSLPGGSPGIERDAASARAPVAPSPGKVDLPASDPVMPSPSEQVQPQPPSGSPAVDCADPRDPRAAAICEERATQLFRDYSRTVKEFRDRLGPAEAKLYGEAEFASEGYRLSLCRFEASLASGVADEQRRAIGSKCVLDAYAGRTAEIEALAAQLSDYSAVPKESSPEDAANLRNSEAELEAARRLLWRSLDPGQTEAFESSHAAWASFRTAECRSRAAMFAAQYGSSGGTQEVCMAQMASERAARIRALTPR